MKYKNAARVIALAAFLFVIPANAQEQIGGKFFAACGPTDGAAITIETENHLRITVFQATLKADEGYRTEKQVFEGEVTSMEVSKCDDKMMNCQPVEAVLSTHTVEADSIKATIEYFDGTETQGDAESIQGHMTSFTAKRDKDAKPLTCG